MTSEQELRELIAFARLQGADVQTGRDERAWEEEGRTLIETVRVAGLAGIGSFPMSVLAAAEVLRRYACLVLPVTELGVREAVRTYMTSNVRSNMVR